MTLRRHHIAYLLRAPALAAFATLALSFIFLPLLGNVRDRIFKIILDRPNYSLSLYVCAPVGILRNKFTDSSGKDFPLPSTFMPTHFQVLIKNDGVSQLDDNALLVTFDKDRTSQFDVVDDSKLKITNILIASRSPLDQSDYKAQFSENKIRISSSRLNPADFILVEGDTNRPIVMSLFAKSRGLTLKAQKGPAECSILSQGSLGEVYLFFRSEQAD